MLSTSDMLMTLIVNMFDLQKKVMSFRIGISEWPFTSVYCIDKATGQQLTVVLIISR